MKDKTKKTPLRGRKTAADAAKQAAIPAKHGRATALPAPAAADKPRTVRLGQFREDPDNVSVATDEEIARLAGKLKRVPLGLTAMRIAYVTDAPGGGCMVVSGNKRLRCLKAAYGEDGEVPAEWFQDITAMSEAERHEFRLNANISDGHFDLDKLLAQYDTAELSEAGLDELLKDITVDGEEFGTDFTLPDGGKSEIGTITFTVHEKQLDAIKAAIKAVGGVCAETFGNTNRNGNAIYEVVRQWLENR